MSNPQNPGMVYSRLETMGNLPDSQYLGIPRQGDTLPEAELFHLNSPIDGFDALINQIQESELPQIEGHPINHFADAIISQFTQEALLINILQNPPDILANLIDIAHSTLSPQIFSDILAFWPPVIPGSDPKVRSFILFLVSLIPRMANPFLFIQWISLTLPPSSWYGESSSTSKSLKAIGKIRIRPKDKEPSWAVLTQTNELTLYDSNLNELHSGNVSSIEVSGEKLAINSSNSELPSLIIPEKGTLTLWQNFGPLPVMISSIGEQHIPPKGTFPNKITYTIPRLIPGVLYSTLYELLIEDDMRIVTTLCFYKVTKIPENGVNVAAAVFDIFAYAGRVNQLLIAVAGSEFRDPQLTPETVLRSNSFLTCLFKLFYERFGRSFYDRLLKKCIEYIDRAGDMGLNNREGVDGEPQRKLFTVIKAFMSSGSAIPPEMRHLGQILKFIVASRFNDFGATYNTVMGFFCLRFFNAIFSNPQGYDSNIELHGQSTQTLIPFSQLLQLVFNRMPLTGKWEQYSKWNQRLTHHTFPQLTNFIMSLCDLNEVPTYQPPTEERLREALQIVTNTIASAPEAFSAQYNLFTSNGINTPAGNPWYPVSWSIASFFLSFFKETRIDLSQRN